MTRAWASLLGLLALAASAQTQTQTQPPPLPHREEVAEARADFERALLRWTSGSRATELKQSLQVKVRALSTYVKLLDALAARGPQPQRACALADRGQAYVHLAGALRAVTPPPELAIEVADQVRAELDVQARPLDEKAKDSFQQAVQAAGSATPPDCVAAAKAGLVSFPK